MADIKKQEKKEAPKPKFVKPYEPNNIHMSRDEYIKDQQEKAEKRAKLEAFKKDLDKEPQEEKVEVKSEEKPAKKGRPKKIE
jgi:predicted RNA-binding protein YlxR (DUF448 family)